MDTLDRIAELAVDDRTARIALALGCQAGDSLAALAVARHGAIQTLHYILTGPKPGETLPMRAWREAIAHRLDPDKIEVVQEQTRELGLEVVIPSDPGWPIPRTDTAPVPLALWTKGDTTLLATPHTSRCAVVGSRAGTDYGTTVTHDLASGLTLQGVTVVSGGWHAIGTTALRAVSAHGGRVVAALAGGLDQFFPASSTALFDRVAHEGGVLISADPPGLRAGRTRRLMRNRLIAAASGAVVLTEASGDSPVLGIAHHAARIGRPVGAVPGPVTSTASSGTNDLLRQRIAHVVADTNDALELLGPGRRPAHLGVGDGREPPGQRPVRPGSSDRPPPDAQPHGLDR
ncbi:DNA-processing protein DprA [Promicromonospora soli]